MRENAGFTIIASEKIGAGQEVVLGWNAKTGQYVTWKWDKYGGYDYGAYFGSNGFVQACESYFRRAGIDVSYFTEQEDEDERNNT